MKKIYLENYLFSSKKYRNINLIMMKDIHKNLPLIQLDYLTFWDYLVLFLVLGILVWIYWKYFYLKIDKTEKIKKEFQVEKFSLKKELDILEKYQKESDWKNFALKATEILKLVLEQKYKEKFLFATGSELIEILNHKKISSEKKEEIKNFFVSLDPVKFNRQKLDQEKFAEIKKIIEKIWKE